MTSQKIYCVKCKEKTETSNITDALSKNDRKMIKGVCLECGGKKASFVKGSPTTVKKIKVKGEGIVSTAAGKIPVIGKYLETGLRKIGLGIKNYSKFKKTCHCNDIDIDEFQKTYRGGFLPLIPILAAVLGGLGGIGGLAGGVASAVNSSKSVAEQERHNKEIEKRIKGAGLRLTPHGSGVFLGPWSQ